MVVALGTFVGNNFRQFEREDIPGVTWTHRAGWPVCFDGSGMSYNGNKMAPGEPVDSQTDSQGVTHLTFVHRIYSYQTEFSAMNLAIDIAIGLSLTLAVALVSEYFIRRRGRARHVRIENVDRQPEVQHD